ncbi:MAG: preprotein translocase subunit SecE [Patescibacteria group bacterium]|jgi:preprotein translocase subunit SecE
MKSNFLINYVADSWSELKKVKWPSRQEVIYHTIIVVASIVAATAITALVDYGLSSLIQYIVEKSKTVS